MILKASYRTEVASANLKLNETLFVMKYNSMLQYPCSHFTMIAKEKASVVLFLSLTLIYGYVSASQTSHCVYGTTVKDLLKLAGINGAEMLSYVNKMKRHNIDQTVLSSLTMNQLHDLGISALGDRLKIYNFFSKDVNDCTSSTCKNNGICRDGFRCFSCVCDPNSKFYGPSCEFKCPCKNNGYCKTIPTGFKCICPPGYSGDLCNIKYLTEDKMLKLEENLKQLAIRLGQSEQEIKNQQVQIRNLESRPTGTWRLHRANEILNQLEKLALHQTTPIYTQKLPIVLPKNTRAIIISVYCNFWNRKGHAYLNYITHQKGNGNAVAKVEGYNTHYNVYANTFLYEKIIPWTSSLSNELVFQVTTSRLDGGNANWYRIRLVGYITSP